MITLNMQTALISWAVMSFFGTIIMSFLMVLYKNKSYGILYFLLFYLFSFVGGLLIAFRDYLPMFISVIIANTSLIVGFIALNMGISKINKAKNKYILYLAISLLYTLLFVYFLYIDLNVVARIMVYCISSIIVLVDCYLIDKKAEQKNKKEFSILRAVIIFLVIIQIFRIVRVLLSNENSDSFLNYNLDAYNIYILGIAYLLITIGVVAKISSEFHKKIMETKRSMANLLDNIPGFAYSCDYDRNWTMRVLSQGFKSITGYETEDVIDNATISFNDLILNEFQEKLYLDWSYSIENKIPFVGEYIIRTKNQEEIWVWEQGNPVYDDDGNVVALEGFITNINQRKILEQTLEELSYRDELTGVYNRRYLESKIVELDVASNYPITIISADINNLKIINDSKGHFLGDLHIKKFALLFKDILGENKIIARIGGDEFIAILPNTSINSGKLILKKFHQRLESKEFLDIGLSAAFGLSVSKDQSVGLAEAIKYADNDMYDNKRKAHI